eukprot:CAMPEP_0180569418 /NCGR_PEP_ID=MMETSP1037_2-20121125/7669_1 /TAXON_ID=632150 /ORGANISM="Azadinium spinosum, Strain 3D9" /LENGTH=84 /DNA_ID=CAMNT_0022586655 /DNA_START=240 /DNA_END=491 /DNA_ORIENTATION=+
MGPSLSTFTEAHQPPGSETPPPQALPFLAPAGPAWPMRMPPPAHAAHEACQAPPARQRPPQPPWHTRAAAIPTPPEQWAEPALL